MKNIYIYFIVICSLFISILQENCENIQKIKKPIKALKSPILFARESWKISQSKNIKVQE